MLDQESTILHIKKPPFLVFCYLAARSTDRLIQKTPTAAATGEIRESGDVNLYRKGNRGAMGCGLIDWFTLW